MSAYGTIIVGIFFFVLIIQYFNPQTLNIKRNFFSVICKPFANIQIFISTVIQHYQEYFKYNY